MREGAGVLLYTNSPDAVVDFLIELQDASAERGSHQANARAPANAQLGQVRASQKELAARGSVLLNTKETS